jgi:hypothetical protein
MGGRTSAKLRDAVDFWWQPVAQLALVLLLAFLSRLVPFLRSEPYLAVVVVVLVTLPVSRGWPIRVRPFPGWRNSGSSPTQTL